MALSKTRTKLLERLRSPRQRPREGAFLVEGIRACREFLGATQPLRVRFALVSDSLRESREGRDLLGSLVAAPFPVEELSQADFEAVSHVERPQGAMLVVSEPADPLTRMEGGPASRILLLDGVQDPGNAGTLIRAARAFGLDGVLALDGTVDPWSPKVVRAAAGSMAHIPVARLTWPEAAGWLEERGVSLFVADPSGEDVRGFHPRAPWALAVGNEGAGSRRALMEKAVRVLAIPMAPGVDSLNAGMAGAILLFTLGVQPCRDAGCEEAED